MQNTICQWFLYVCLLFLPINSEANIDAKIGAMTPSASPSFSQPQRHFPRENSTEHLGYFKKWARFFENQQNTEGSPKTEKSLKQARWKWFFRILICVIAGLALIYFLQGKFLLALITFALIAYWRNQNKIKNWQQHRDSAYKRRGVDNSSLQHPDNKWTRRAIDRFLIGIGIFALGVILLLLSLAAEAVLTLALLTLLAGYLTSLVGFFNAIQALIVKEPQSDWAWLVVLLGLPAAIVILLLASISI
jgi:uncharacterized membrane protein HdeD (DUF308 family)